MKTASPIVSRQEVHWVPEGRKIQLPEEPYRVWTLFEQDPTKTPSLPMVPVHNDGAFLEDKIHDWRFKNGTLSYYSRLIQHSVWILVEYTTQEKP